MSELNDYDIDFEEDDDSEIEAEETKGDQLDLDCFTNLIGSSNCTVKIYSDDISEDSINILKEFPGADVQIVNIPDVNIINKDSCNILSKEEDVSDYVIIFVKYGVASYLLAEYDIELDTANVMSEGDIEDEASNIVEGTDYESSGTS